MIAQPGSRRVQPAPAAEIGVALAAGLVLGGFISLAAFLLARYGPAGGDWSFRGNGALAAYSLIPAFLAGGWTAVVLYHRDRPWVALGAMAAVVGVCLAAVDAALLPVFGPRADQIVGPVILVALAAWTGLAPLLAVRLPRVGAAESTRVGLAIGAAIALGIGLALGLIAVGIVIPAGS